MARGLRLPGADRYGDLAVQLSGRAAVGGTWRRLEPCGRTPQQHCEFPAFPQLDPDLSFRVGAKGTVAGRVRVNVDYDPARETGAADQVHIRYEGREGEGLRQVDFGRVALPPLAGRYLAAAVPSPTTGVLAATRWGSADVHALWGRSTATQARREFRRGVGGGSVGEEARVSFADAEYARAQFFFLFDPARIRGFPHLDVTALTSADAPRSMVPRAGVQLYRYTGTAAADGSTPLLHASTPEAGTGRQVLAGPFRLLAPGADYHLHPSGTWVALRTPLGDDEALAVIYVAADGAWVGDPAPGANGAREARLLRPVRTSHRPGTPAWPLEMRHLYTLTAAADLDPGAVRVVISRGEASGGDLSRPHPVSGRAIPYLRLFGLDEAPPSDVLDPVRVYRPAREQADSPLRAAYLVFPTLYPFAAPPPLSSEGLSAEAAAATLGSAANPAVYEAADERERRAAARFQIAATLRLQGGQALAVFPLGTTMIREGSERVHLGTRLLQRGQDYEVLYDVGEVHLRDPGILSSLAPDAELRITFEERSLFPIAPTYVGGFRAGAPLRGGGGVSAMAVLQQEVTPLRRTPLGGEPDALLVGGASATWARGVPWLSGRVAALSRGRDTTRAQVRLTGEAAGSLPVRPGAVTGYLDDFEEASEIPLPLLRSAWKLGSQPRVLATHAGRPAFEFSPATAGELVWQHDVREPGGRVVSGLRTAEIDTILRVTQGGRLSPVLHLTLTSGGPGTAWRAVTTVLSPSGRDLREQAYLEFYARGGGEGDAILLDLGTVSEDALAFGPDGATSGVDASGRPWGAGILDREWDPATEAWTPAHDRHGLWDSSCVAEPAASYPLGDPRANCTRGNGSADTEDLNGNGVLDVEERVIRFLVRLDDPRSPFLVRDSTVTGTGYRLYRVPLRRDAADEDQGVDLRAVHHLRLTLVGGTGTAVSLARMRLVGSRWQKHGATGTERGLVGVASAGATATGRLEVDHVSRALLGTGYVSPPGVRGGLQDPRSGRDQLSAVEYNEKALRLRYSDLESGGRAEAYLDLAPGPRSFLPYRELRLWVLAREGRWGADGERMFVRVGNGPEDHYLYVAPVSRRSAPTSAADWGPEVVIELSRWQALRAEAERLLYARAPGRTEPLVLWDADSTYVVVVRDRGRAPNLASVREISVGVWNAGAYTGSGELWINDVRLTGADPRPGIAAQLSLGVDAGRLGSVDVSYAREDGYFHQFGAPPGYQQTDALTFTGRLELGHLAPPAWGLSAPLQLSARRAETAPILLRDTDLPAVLLDDLRTPRDRDLEVRLDLRRQLPSTTRWGQAAIDPLSLRIEAVRSQRTDAFVESARTGTSVALSYDVSPVRRTLALSGLLPARFGKRLGLETLRWTPASLSMLQERTGGVDLQTRYESRWDDAESAAAPLTNRAGLLVQQVSIGVQPFGPLRTDVVVRSTRDLTLPGAAGPNEGPAVPAQPRLGGIGYGWEAERIVTSRVQWIPQLASWAGLEAGLDGAFALRDDSRFGSAAAGDGVAMLNVAGQQKATARVRVQPQELARVLGAALPDSGGAPRTSPLAAGLLKVLGTVNAGVERRLESRYDRLENDPPVLYQMGWTGAGQYRALGDVAAGTAAETTVRHASTQFLLPGALSLDVSVDVRRTEVFGLRNERQETERRWPDVGLQWEPRALPWPLRSLARTATAGAGFRTRLLVREDPSADQGQRLVFHALPLRASVVWRGGISTTYQGEWRLDTARLPSTDVENHGGDHHLTVGGMLTPPRMLALPAREPLTLALSLREVWRDECRITAMTTDCRGDARFSASRERSARLRMDSRASEHVTVGLYGEYVNRHSMVTEQTTLTQYNLGIFAQYNVGLGIR